MKKTMGNPSISGGHLCQLTFLSGGALEKNQVTGKPHSDTTEHKPWTVKDSNATQHKAPERPNQKDMVFFSKHQGFLFQAGNHFKHIGYSCQTQQNQTDNERHIVFVFFFKKCFFMTSTNTVCMTSTNVSYICWHNVSYIFLPPPWFWGGDVKNVKKCKLHLLT